MALPARQAYRASQTKGSRLMRRSRYAGGHLAVSLLLLTLVASPASAAPGDLDTSFGGDGWETTDFGLGDVGRDVAIQPDGKIVVVGWTQTADGADFAVARYNADGTLDGSFGDAGKVTTSPSSGEDKAIGVAVQPDGAIVVAGVTWSGPEERQAFGVVRYASDGEVDTAFGTDGIVRTNFTSRRDRAAAVAIQNDGRIVVAGTAYPGDFAVARYTPDGILDTSFSGDGKQRTSRWRAREVARGLGVQGNGKIVVSGSSNRKLAVVRFTQTGASIERLAATEKPSPIPAAGWEQAGADSRYSPMERSW
jgi:uncharacterized delta-60 repeat protein